MTRHFQLATALVFATASLTAGSSVPAAAQESAALDEQSAYLGWYAANEAKDIPKAVAAAGEYLAKFPSGQYADFLKKWVAGARGNQFNAALKAGDMASAVKLGRERLKEDPKDLNYLYSLAFALRPGLFASPPKTAHAADAAEFAGRAVKLIEAGGIPAGFDAAKWNKNGTLAWMHQLIAMVAAQGKKPDEALAEFEKSSALDPKNAAIVAYNSLSCGSLRKDKYDAAVEKYKAVPEAQKQGAEPGPDAKAALDEANKQADAAIACWARFLGKSEGLKAFASVRDRIQKTAEGLYAYRHPDDAGGLEKAIAAAR